MTNNQLVNLENKIASQEVVGQLAAVLGTDEKARNFAGSVLAEIKRSQGDEKKDLTRCSPDSIVQAMIDAANFGLSIDGRKHAHLVKYGNAVQMQIGYAGYAFKLAEAFPDADVTTNVVYEGDQLEIDEKDGIQTYTFKRKNSFENDDSKIIGAFAAISYTNRGGVKVQKVTTLPRGEINKIRAKAKQDYVWKDWFTEKAKIAVFRRACKMPFQGILGLQKLLEYDNRNFDLMEKKLPRSQPENIIDHINQVIEQEAVVETLPPIIEQNPEPEEAAKEEIKSFKVMTRGKVNNYATLEEWEKAVENVLKSYTDITQFSVFLKKNKDHFEEVAAAGGENFIKKIDQISLKLQEKIQQGE